MGKFDGKQIIGLVGGVVFKKGRDKNVTIIQTKAVNVRQTKATIDAGSLFGKASSLAKNMRIDFSVLTDDYYDGGMVNRFTKLNREILAHCYDKNTKKYTFKSDSFDRLKGFEFNQKSLLANSLWINPVVTLTNNQLRLDFPELNIPEHLRFPSTANTCIIKVVLSQFILDQALQAPYKYQDILISKNQSTIPAQQLSFDVPDGCLCIVGINLYFTEQKNGTQTILNNKSFNPAAICGATISPGNFVPSPIAKTRAAEWDYLPELKL